MKGYGLAQWKSQFERQLNWGAKANHARIFHEGLVKKFFLKSDQVESGYQKIFDKLFLLQEPIAPIAAFFLSRLCIFPQYIITSID